MIKSHIVNRIGYAALALAAPGEVAGTSTTDSGGDGTEKLESETGFLSLAALAGADTSGIQALANRVPPAGIWRVQGDTVKLSQGEGRDGKAPPFRIGYIYLVRHGKSTDPEFDNEKMVDRKLRESFTIWPDDIEEGIGLTKGRYLKAGISNSEPKNLGGVESQPPGWLDNFTGAEFDLRIRHGIRNNETVAYYDWLPAEAAEEVEE
ncbi:hypothetical protein K2Y11_08810 [bacterium]|nr:hypothetical protein [bacterium]